MNIDIDHFRPKPSKITDAKENHDENTEPMDTERLKPEEKEEAKSEAAAEAPKKGKFVYSYKYVDLFH